MAKVLAIDIETTGPKPKGALEFATAKIIVVATSMVDSESLEEIEGHVFNVGLRDLFHEPHSRVEVQSTLDRLMEQADWVAFHNGAFDIPLLVRDGYIGLDQLRSPTSCRVIDTLVTARLVGPQDRVGLEPLARKYRLVTPRWSELKVHRADLTKIAVESALEYGGLDAIITAKLASKFLYRVDQLYRSDQLVRSRGNLVVTASGMTLRGQSVNKSWIDQETERLRNLIHSNVKQLHEFDIQDGNDHAGVRRLIVKDLHDTGAWDKVFGTLEKTEKTQQLKTSETALLYVAASGYCSPVVTDVVRMVLETRKAQKIMGTWFDSMDRHLSYDGRLHSGWQPGGALTGRMTSNNPAIQTLPRDMTGGLWGQHIHADVSQAELRVAALFAGENQMAASFANGEDIHRATAMALFPKEDPDSETFAEYRQIGKQVNFLTVYGGGPQKLAAMLDIDEDFAATVLKKFNRAFPNLKRQAKEFTDRWEKHRKITMVDGSYLFATRNDLERSYKAGNNVIQGTVALMMNEALVELDRRGLPLVSQIYDAINVETEGMSDAEIQDAMGEMVEVMSKCPAMLVGLTDPDIPIKVDVELVEPAELGDDDE